MVDVHKMSDPTNKRTSKFGARNPGTAGWQGTGELDENDVIDDPNKRNLRVARSERQRLDRAIATALASPILLFQPLVKTMHFSARLLVYSHS